MKIPRFIHLLAPLSFLLLLLLSTTQSNVVSASDGTPTGEPFSISILAARPVAYLSNSSLVLKQYEKLPLYFIANQGQIDQSVAYYLQGSDKTLYFTPQGVTFVLTAPSPQGIPLDKQAKLTPLYSHHRGQIPAAEAKPQSWVVKLDFVDANPNVQLSGQGLTPTRISYFKGQAQDWKTGVATYSSLVYTDLWPGIDLIYRGTADRLKYEFVVKPGADPSQIRLAYRGVSAATLNEVGQLEVLTPVGGFTDDVPYAYQEIAGQRRDVSMAYALASPSTPSESHSYSFRIGNYDRRQPLVLDPAILLYAGYLGGSADEYGRDLAVDSSGNVYVTGWTNSSEATFPVQAGPDLTYNGGEEDIFIFKLNASGTALIYGGYIGGPGGEDGAYGIAVDAAGNAYIAGQTNSSETTFPVTVGPDLTINGGADAFVAKLSADGTTLIYAGYIGGSGADYGEGLVVDNAGNAYVVGDTYSNDFPVAAGPGLTSSGGPDVFVTKVNASGTALDFSGYVGGGGYDEGNDIALDPTGNIYLFGSTGTLGTLDAFVAKVTPSGTLSYYRTIGGTDDDQSEAGTVDSEGRAYVVGETLSSEASFPVAGGPDPTHNGDYDGFVARVNAAGTAIEYAGYIGGSGRDQALGAAIDNAGNLYVTGLTASTETTFPVAGEMDQTYNGGAYDAFLTKIDPTGANLLYSGYLGGSNDDESWDVALDSDANVYLTGPTNSPETSFPVIAGPDLTYNGGFDIFFAKFAQLSTTFLQITTSSPLPTGTIGEPYTVTLTAYGGTVPYVWGISASSLAPGLELSSSTGVIGGIPMAVGAYTFTAVVTDSTTTTASTEFVLEISDSASIPDPILNPANGHYYQFIPNSLAWEIARADAESRHYLDTTGHLATISSGVEQQFIESSFPLTVGLWLGGYQPAGSPEPNGNWQWVTSEPFTYTHWSPGEPNNDTGNFEGLEDKLMLRGDGFWNDHNPAARHPYLVEYDLGETLPPLTISTESPLPPGLVGEAYTTTLQATGGSAPYQWRIASSSLPPGLALAVATGQMSGIPTASGSYTFTVVVTDSHTSVVNKTFSLTVLPATEPPSGPWQLTSPMTTPRFWLGAVASGQYLYALGGRPEPTPGNDNGFDSIERAFVNADGTLASWNILTSTLTTGRYLVPVVASHGYLYAVGGHDNFGNYLSSVERAPIYADGALGSWQVISNMTTGRYAHAAIAVGDYLYALGGYTGTWDNGVERAVINSDGTLGPWQLISTMTTGREDAAVVYWNGYLYAIGGHNPTMLNSVERAAVNPDGSLGDWQLMSSLVNARTRAGGVAIGGHLYAIGGGNTSDLTSVEQAEINADGSLGAWQVVSDMTTARGGGETAYANGHIYALGGIDANGTALASVEMTAVEGEPPSTNLVVNGSFEDPALPGDIAIYGVGGSLPGWFVQEGSIDLVSPQFWDADDGNQSIDLTGNCAEGVIYQDLATAPSQSYRLSFAMAGNPEGDLIKEMQVLWDSTLVAQPTFDITETDYHDMRWVHYEYTVVATAATTRLTFRSLTSGCQGAALDSVRLEATSQVSTPVIVTASTLPTGTVDEPYTVTLVAVGGTPPYGWGLTSASLAPGLYLDSATGIIHGSPTTAGIYTFTTAVTDSVSAVGTKQFILSIASTPQLFTDLGISATDIQFTPSAPQPGQLTAIRATVHNLGLTSVANASVAIFDLAVPLGQSTIANLAPGASVEVTMTATFTGANFHLIDVRVDPLNTIAEVNEVNNEASKVLQVGQPDPSQAVMVIQASAPVVCQGASTAISGNAYYDFANLPGQNDHPVQGGAIKITLLDPSNGNAVSIFTGAHTDINGAYSQAVIAPLADAAYPARVEVTDKSITATVQTTLTVSAPCPEPPVVPPPPPPSSEPNPGTPPPSGPPASGGSPAGDLYLSSEDIYFSDDNPDPGESIQLFAYIHYYGSEAVAEIPVTLYEILPVNGTLVRIPIGSAQIGFADGGSGPAVVAMPWIATPQGAHIIQVVVEPPFAQFTGNDEATRLILVGDAAQIQLFKQVSLLLDADGNNEYSPGDTLQYSIIFQNNGGPAVNALLLDDYDETLLLAPAQISNGGVLTNGLIIWNLSTLPTGGSGSVSYQAQLLAAGDFPSGHTVVHNIALLTAEQTPAVAASAAITVSANLTPTIDVVEDQTVAEGNTVTLTATAHDPDGDAITYSWDLDNDSLFELSGQVVTFSAVTRDGPAVQPVMVRVCDDVGACVTASASVTITNQPPIITAVSNSGPIAVGASAAITVSATDAAGANDPLNYEFDCDGDNAYEIGPQPSLIANCAFNSPGEFSVYVRVTDGDGGEDTATTTVIVRPSTAPLTQDSFLRSGDTNTNEGANLTMVVRASGSNRALLSFGMLELPPFADDIQTVTLRLYIVYNGNNWGNEGRTIDIHQVNTLWQEGNGANLQPSNLTNAQFNPYQNQGAGAGTTWKCATDSDIQNQQTNCNPQWNGGSFDATPSDAVTIYKDFGGNNNLPPTTKTVGWIEFDVTADVIECIANQATTCSWLIKKTQEGQEGLIEFATKEGAQAYYNTLFGGSVAPRLQVTYQASSASSEQTPHLFIPMIDR